MNKRNEGNLFFKDPRHEVTISAGKTLLPCHFRKVHYTVALFRTGSSAAGKLLEGTGLKPALAWGHQRVVAVGLIKYMDSDLGAYDEVILSVPSVPLHMKEPLSNWLDMLGPVEKRRVGHYIAHIPVTSEFSRAAGYELWGFPKFVTQISHRFERDTLESTLYDPEGKRIMGCRGRLGFSIPSIPLSLMTYSTRNGRNLRTSVNVIGRMRAYPAHSLVLEVGDSDHPMAADLRMLGLDGKRPLMVLDSDRFQAVFREGMELNDEWQSPGSGQSTRNDNILSAM